MAEKKPLFVTPETRTVPIENSSHVRTVTYKPESRVLSVQFKNGDIYDYLDVPYKSAVELAQAESVGSYLNRVIRPAFSGSKRPRA
jgi:hypothetical protein